GVDRRPPPLLGHYVGAVDDLEAALAWITRWTFAAEAPLPGPESRALSLGPAPIPGGALLDGFGTHLLAVVVDAAEDDGGSRPFRWPAPPPELPERWHPAAILSQRAPLFAAPAPRLPPFAESHDVVQRSDDLYVIGVVDRCDGDGDAQRCTRWDQVLVHEHGRWRGGYLPAAQVAQIDGWLRAPRGLPRVQAIPAGIDGADALVLVVIRTPDYDLHRLTLRLPRAAGGFPDYAIELAADAVIVTIAGEETARVPLNASIDARPR
ncbi:MAG: hypothetical protein KC486_31625, partial [Myxococcales bacterium]|nr:hypothetical protein [Myxococcales bacterium]